MSPKHCLLVLDEEEVVDKNATLTLLVNKRLISMESSIEAGSDLIEFGGTLTVSF